MAPKYPHTRIRVFAREPVLGLVKTRLHSAIGPERALQLYKAMLTRITSTLAASNLAAWDLCVTSGLTHEMFVTICDGKNITLQSEGDLGQKMSTAMAYSLAQAEVENVIVIGSDCPAMSQAYLESAIRGLNDGNDVVIGPAEDGGYVLLGLKRPYPELFEGIPWGSAQVLNLTLQRVQELGASCQLLEPLWDVDRDEDLPRLQELDPPLDWVDESPE